MDSALARGIKRISCSTDCIYDHEGNNFKKVCRDGSLVNRAGQELHRLREERRCALLVLRISFGQLI
jgi:hypothetical protein